MGVKDTLRGLGCMGKTVVCLLFIVAIPLLAIALFFGLMFALFSVVEFLQDHCEAILSVVGVVLSVWLVRIVLKLANGIGKIKGRKSPKEGDSIGVAT